MCVHVHLCVCVFVCMCVFWNRQCYYFALLFVSDVCLLHVLVFFLSFQLFTFINFNSPHSADLVRLSLCRHPSSTKCTPPGPPPDPPQPYGPASEHSQSLTPPVDSQVSSAAASAQNCSSTVEPLNSPISSTFPMKSISSPPVVSASFASALNTKNLAATEVSEDLCVSMTTQSPSGAAPGSPILNTAYENPVFVSPVDTVSPHDLTQKQASEVPSFSSQNSLNYTSAQSLTPVEDCSHSTGSENISPVSKICTPGPQSHIPCEAAQSLAERNTASDMSNPATIVTQQGNLASDVSDSPTAGTHHGIPTSDMSDPPTVAAFQDPDAFLDNICAASDIFPQSAQSGGFLDHSATKTTPSANVQRKINGCGSRSQASKSVVRNSTNCIGTRRISDLPGLHFSKSKKLF